ncbi:HalOD1 output domain-containing protein [Halobacteriaceae archaeon GCM10025711]
MTESSDEGAVESSRETYTTHHDMSADDVSVSVVMAVAAVAGVDPSDLRERLSDVVDPDGLDTIFRPQEDGTSRTDGHVAFPFLGYEVTVFADGTITVTPTDETD